MIAAECIGYCVPQMLKFDVDLLFAEQALGVSCHVMADSNHHLIITGTLVFEAFPSTDAFNATFKVQQEQSSGGAGGCDAKERRELKATMLNLATQGKFVAWQQMQRERQDQDLQGHHR